MSNNTELEQLLNKIKTEKDTKIIPENIKKGVTIFNVQGAAEGGVKQFSTVEEMNSSTGNTEGDLAIVYRSEVQNAKADSRFQTAIFPDTVVLDNAMTDSVGIAYSAVDSSVTFDCMGSIDSSNFYMAYRTEKSGTINIQYTSSDGITYTRTDTNGNPVDFGTEIYYEMTEYWNDVIGKFIQIGVNVFEGLYKYSDSSWILAPTQLSAIADYVYGKEFYGKNGVEIGTLGTPNNSFADISAEIVYKIQNQYENMEPRVLTDSDKTIDTNIYILYQLNLMGQLC